MKNFLTSMLGSLAALVIFAFVGCLLVIGIVAAVVSLGVKNATNPGRLESGSYMVFDLSANITDAPPVFDFGDFSDDSPDTLQLRTVTRAIRAAAADPRIAGILLKGSLRPTGVGTGYGALGEVRAALLRFRAAGKPIEAYVDFATTRDYYLASAADKVILDPYGVIYMPGLAVEPMFYAGAFEKYGVDIQVTRVGKYKSYVEPFIRKDMSPENRLETQRLLDDLWGGILTDIGHTRHLLPAKIQSTVDTEGLIRPETATAVKMVDRVAYRDQLIDELKVETGRKGSKDTFKQISLAAYARLVPDPHEKASGPAVAVVYAEGDIVEGEGTVGEIGGLAFAREVRKLRQDDSIKAIVLRVNSPGGSATAAETIQREMRLARQVKPVIISMGSYAASGGYWISAYGDRIFADPASITGSIGVFGIQFDVQKLANDFGITFDGVKTGKFADSLTITRPKTPEEMAILQREVDWIYGQFIGKVSEGRKMSPTDVERIAQGRVWSGGEAIKLGLVDEIGGLDAALHYAEKKANLSGEFRIVEYPAKKDFAEVVADFLGKIAPDTARTRSAPWLAQIEKRLTRELADLKAFNDPQGVYARLPLTLTLH